MLGRHIWFALLPVVAAPAFAEEPPNYAGETLPKGSRVERNVFYTADKRIAQSLDIVIPKSDKLLPLVVWIHGGGWEMGTKAQCPLMYLAGKGYAVATINYRLTNVAIYPAQIEDCKGAIRQLRADAKKYNVDPNRIGVAGHSAGGHLAALLGTTAGNADLEGPKDRTNPDVSSGVQCVCDCSGPSNILSLAKSFAGTPLAKDPTNPVARLLGGMLPEKDAVAKLASPALFVKKGDPPFLIIHGDRDNVCPVEQSRELNDVLKKAGVESTLLVVAAGGHNEGIFDNRQVLARISDFFDKQLKK